MIHRWFTSYSPINQILIPLIATLIWLPYHFASPYTPVSSDLSFINYIFPQITGLTAYPWGRTILNFLLLMAGTIISLRIFIKFNLVTQRSYTVSFLYILISSFLVTNKFITLGLLTSILLLLIFFKIFEMYESDNPVKNIFEVSFLLSTGTFISSSFIWLLPPALLSIFLVRNDLNIKAVIAIPLGLFVPVYIVASLWYIAFQNLQSISDYFLSSISQKRAEYIFTENFYINIFFLIIVSLISIYWMYRERSRKISIRRFNTILLIFVVYLAVLFLIQNQLPWFSLLWIGVPLTFIITNWILTYHKKLIIQFSIIIFLALYIINIVFAML